jgi:cobalt/nickel transport system ATP-binding protein
MMSDRVADATAETVAGAVTEAAYTVENLVYRYNNEIAALNDVSFSIARGTSVAILGANGSGKSTLLRILDGLYFPERGSVSVFGEPLTEERLQDDAFAYRFRQQVAFVFQNPDVQLFNPTVFDEIAFGPLQLRWPKAQIQERVEEMLQMFEISHLRQRAPHRLSGGEKKRVALASVLILDPEVLLLDEPTAALDPKSQRTVLDFLVGWGGTGKTIITTTHDLDTVMEIAEQCLVFENGKLIAADTPAATLNNNDLLARANIVHAHRQAGDFAKIHAKDGPRPLSGLG